MKRLVLTGWKSLAEGFKKDPMPTFMALLIPLILFLGNSLLEEKDGIIAEKNIEIKNANTKLDSCNIRELRLKDKVIEEYKEIERETKAALKNKKKR